MVLRFLFPFMPSQHDVERYGCAPLAEKGFEVQVLDLGPLVAPGVTTPMLSLSVPVVRIDRFGDLEAIAADGAGLYFDYLTGLTEPASTAAKVLKLVGVGGNEYVIVSGAPLPPAARPGTARQAAIRTVRRLAKTLDLHRLTEFLGRRLRRLVPPAYSLPALVFSTHAPAVEAYLARTRLPMDRVRWMNSFDYDTYVEFMRRREDRLPKQTPTAVFLDEAASSHRDFEVLGETSLRIGDAEYGRAMRRFFDAVEARTSLQVMVAAHPHSDYDSRPGFFGEREVVVGMTLELLASAAIVIAHSSTAVGYAALLDKPTLVVKTRDMERTGYVLQVDGVARALGLDAVSVDDEAGLAGFDWDYARWPRDGFADYLYRYVRSPEVPADRTTWDIVAYELQRMFAG